MANIILFSISRSFRPFYYNSGLFQKISEGYRRFPKTVKDFGSAGLFMRRFRGCQLLWHIKLPNIYEGVIDASVNACCKLKLAFLEKRL